MNRSIDIVLPVYNESKVLESKFKTLYEFLSLNITNEWIITIAENGSSDSTLQIAKNLHNRYKKSRVISNPIAGKGLALKNAWISSTSGILGYMDLDLSTDLDILPEFIRKIEEEEEDFVIASRLMRDSIVVGRSLKREVISRSYSFIFRSVLSVKFKDAQCGFKFAKKESVIQIIDKCKDIGWFFDTEILFRAQKNNLSICEVPVRWVDDRDSKVDIISTVIKDIKGLIRLKTEKDGR
ncbi:MAG: glycosyltransferase [Chloroflexota bacterium]